jgi:hypothetical protein
MGVMVAVSVMVVMMAMPNLVVVAMAVFEIVLVARHSHVFYRSPVVVSFLTGVFFPFTH